MSIADCTTCRQYSDEAALSIKVHLEAVTRLTHAVQQDVDDMEIFTLQEMLQARDAERQWAVARYKRHMDEHTPKTMTAGSGQALGF
jgi:hypothetical protein